MSLSKLREALESHPTTSPTPSHMAHGCIPSTVVSTGCRPLYSQGSLHQAGVEALQLYSLYSSTALQRSTVYILYTPPLDNTHYVRKNTRCEQMVQYAT